jgi:integrase
MAARRRSRARRDWPAGLREPKPGYYAWEHPETGKIIGIGRVPLADAKLQAIEANLLLQGERGAPRLVDKLSGAAELTLGEWLDDWIGRLEGGGKKAQNTLRGYRTLARTVKSEPDDSPAGLVPLARCSTAVIADCLEAIEKNRGARSAQAARSMLKAAFRAAIAKGKVTSNPVLVTEGITVDVKRQRFTWETFSKVWGRAEIQGEPWLRNAVALALVSGQRREDVAAALFSDFSDTEWRLQQGKTGHKLAIPLDLRLDVLGMSLRDVLQACRRTGVVSRHLIHQTRPYGNSPVGSPMFVDRISKRFTDAVVAALGPGEGLPTFHELRSLSKRLYVAQGGVDTKALLGHATDRMADQYADARGAEFERVKLG